MVRVLFTVHCLLLFGPQMRHKLIPSISEASRMRHKIAIVSGLGFYSPYALARLQSEFYQLHAVDPKCPTDCLDDLFAVSGLGLYLPYAVCRITMRVLSTACRYKNACHSYDSIFAATQHSECPTTHASTYARHMSLTKCFMIGCGGRVYHTHSTAEFSRILRRRPSI
jgi:hypothetical protein